MKTRTRAKSRRSRKNKLNRELKKELGKKLLGYSVTAGAVLTIGAGVAEAVAIRVDNQIDIFPNNSFNLDINSDGFIDVRFGIYNTIQRTSVYSYATVGGYVNNQIVGTFNTTFSIAFARNVPTNVSINTNLLSNAYPFALLQYRLAYDTNPQSELFNYGQFMNNPGFLGVEFDISGNTHFGWVELEVVGSPNSPFDELKIYGWGYETFANTGILPGEGQEAIPEPATLVTLAMGAAGLYAWRRGRKRKGMENATQKEHQNA